MNHADRELGLYEPDMGPVVYGAWLRAYDLAHALGGQCSVEVLDAGANWEAKATRLSDSQVSSELIPKA